MKTVLKAHPAKWFAALTLAILLPLQEAHAIATRWLGPYNLNGNDAGALAGEACWIEVNSGWHVTLGVTGAYGEGFGYACDAGGWNDMLVLQPSCDGIHWPGTLGMPLHELDATACQTGRKNLGPCPWPSCGAGNPIYPGFGNKYQREPDYIGAGPNPLKFIRSYNSKGPQESGMGWVWRSTFDRSIAPIAESVSMVLVRREDGKVLPFIRKKNGATVPTSPYDPAAQWVPDGDVVDRLEQLVDGSGNTTGWTYYLSGPEEFEAYDASGRLTSVTTRMGLTQTVAYDSQGRPQSVTDAFGRTLGIAVNARGVITSITDPAGAVYQYAYDANMNKLMGVTYPGSVARQYVYNEQSLTQSANLPFALTGIVDELGNRFATFGYIPSGMAVTTEHAGGVEKYSISYSVGSSAVTDPLGTTRNNGFTTILEMNRSTGLSEPCPSCGANFSAIGYDTNGNAISLADFNGKKTCRAFDATRNLETARVEGALSSESCATVLATLPSRSDARKSSTQWHGTWRLPVKIAEPNRITTLIYNGDLVSGTPFYCAPTTATVNGNPIGVLCKKTVQETTDATGQQAFGATVSGTPRTWSFTYDAYGQVLTATDPNNRTTTTAYYPANDSDLGKRGNVHTVTNALGHVTTVTAYDANGRPLSITDPNGLVTTLAYHPRGWLTSRTVGGETTNFQYDAVGQLTRVTLPDASYVQYTYDLAHRLIQLQDGLGNKTVYTLDAMGNRIKEESFDPGNQLSRKRHQVFDSLNRLHQSIGAQ